MNNPRFRAGDQVVILENAYDRPRPDDSLPECPMQGYFGEVTGFLPNPEDNITYVMVRLLRALHRCEVTRAGTWPFESGELALV